MSKTTVTIKTMVATRMRRFASFFLPVTLSLFCSCNEIETANEILQKTIVIIDTIESVYYKQDMIRTNPQDHNDTISRFREMYFERLISDSIVGVKGHWFMYVDDKINVYYEDIYDGKRLVRKNNKDSVARLYDLEKYPKFKKQHFWGHNTPYAMQYEFKHMLEHSASYSILKLNDTLILGKPCFQILVKLEGKTTMPGFLTRLEDSEGSTSEILLAIDKKTYYPIRMKGVSYTTNHPEQMMFIDQKYYDIAFNLSIDKAVFETSEGSLRGYEIREMQPK